jgi:hypothetical protein
LSDGNYRSLEVQKNEGFRTLFDRNDVIGMFYEDNSYRCLIYDYELRHPSNNSLIEPGQKLFDMLDLGNRIDESIEMDTFREMTDGTIANEEYDFDIVAKAYGGVERVVTVSLNHVICRYESISGVDTPLTWTLPVLPNANETLFNFSELFGTNDSYCPPINFEFFRHADQELNYYFYYDMVTDDYDLANYNFVNETHMMLFPQWPDEYRFFIVARSVFGTQINNVATAEFHIDVICVPESQTMTVVDPSAIEYRHYRRIDDQPQYEY